jgi:hypothetical protein
MIEHIFTTPIYNGEIEEIDNISIKETISYIESVVPEEIKCKYTDDERNGWDCNMKTSAGYEGGFLNLTNNPAIVKLKESILKEVINYTKLANIVGNVEMMDSFYNIGLPGTFQEFHNHNPMHLSCVYYVDADECSGDLVLTDSRFAERKRISPKTSGIRIFPSHINHQVNINETKNTRISIACNFIINLQ